MKNDPRLDDHLAFFQLDVPAATTLRMQWPFTSIYERNLKELIGPSFSTNTWMIFTQVTKWWLTFLNLKKFKMEEIT